MANIMEMREYDKVVRRFVDDYVNNLTPDQMREIISEQTHIDFENIRRDTGQVSVFEEMAGWDSELWTCLLYTSPSPRDQEASRMPSSA